MAEATAHVPSQPIKLALIDPSPHNPRKVFWGIAELAEQIKAQGVLQPLIVRPFGERFELVAGERRLRASKKAGLVEVPAIVRELSDQQAREIQLHENLDRADLSPIEEAQAFAALQRDFGLSVEDLAQRFGKSKRTIHAALQLLNLGEAAREQLLAGRLSASVALLIARIPGEELQAKAAAELAGNEESDPVPYRTAQDLIQRNFMVRLEYADFDLADAKLVPDAGACTTCPKRTGNQRELFAEIKSADVCTDPACFQRKRSALVELKLQAAEKEGRKVLRGKAAEKLFDKHDQLRTDYVRISATGAYIEGRGYVANLDKIAPKDARILLQDPRSGQALEVVPVKALPAPKKKKAAPATPKGETPDQKAKRIEQEKLAHDREVAAQRFVGALVARAEKRLDKPALLVIAQALAHNAELFDAIARRAGKLIGELPDGGGQKLERDFENALPRMSEQELRGVVFELAAVDSMAIDMWRDGMGGDLVAIGKALGVVVDQAKYLPASPAPAKPAAPAKKKGAKK